jgi:hypothetical protein
MDSPTATETKSQESSQLMSYNVAQPGTWRMQAWRATYVVLDVELTVYQLAKLKEYRGRTVWVKAVTLLSSVQDVLTSNLDLNTYQCYCIFIGFSSMLMPGQCVIIRPRLFLSCSNSFLNNRTIRCHVIWDTDCIVTETGNHTRTSYNSVLRHRVITFILLFLFLLLLLPLRA